MGWKSSKVRPSKNVWSSCLWVQPPWFRLAEQNKKQHPQVSSSVTKRGPFDSRGRFNSRAHSNVNRRMALQGMPLKTLPRLAEIRPTESWPFCLPILHRHIKHQIDSKRRHNCWELTIWECLVLAPIVAVFCLGNTTLWVPLDQCPFS